jgi:fibronectin-binding autotransporter adhesin
MAGALAASAYVQAITYTWDGNNGNLNDSTNWAGGVIPPVTGADVTLSSGDVMKYFPNSAANGFNDAGRPTAGSIIVQSGAQFNMGGATWGNRGVVGSELVLAGTGPASGGALRIDGGGDTNSIRAISLSANATMQVDSRFDIRDGGGQSIKLNGFTLTSRGTGGFNTVDTVVTGPGNINIEQGSFSPESNTTIPSSVTVNMSPGTTLAGWGNGRDAAPSQRVEAAITLNNSNLGTRWGEAGKVYAGPLSVSGTTATLFAENHGSGPGDVQRDNYMVVAGKVSGSGVVNIGGNGTVILTNPANDFTGGLSIGNKLQIGAAGAIPANSKVTLNAGASLSLKDGQIKNLNDNNFGVPDPNRSGTSYDVTIGNGSTLSGKVTGDSTLRIGTGTTSITGSAQIQNAGGVEQLAGSTLQPVGDNALGGIVESYTVVGNSTLKPTNQGLKGYHGPSSSGAVALTPAGMIADGLQTGIPAIDSTAKPYGDNNRFLYTGNITNTTNDPIRVSFGEQYDDDIDVIIDGVTVLTDRGWNTATAGSVTLSPGAHTISIQSFDGVGGAGPNSGWNKGVGIAVVPADGSADKLITDVNGGGDNAKFGIISKATMPAGLLISSGAGATEARGVDVNAGVVLTVDTGDLLGGSYKMNGPLAGDGGFTIQGDVTFGNAGGNTFTGPTVVNAGSTLRQGTGENLSPMSELTVNGTLQITEGDDTAGSLAGSGTVNLNGNTLNTGGKNTSTTFSGTLNGAGGALTKTGTGAQTLSGSTSVATLTLEGGKVILPMGAMASADTAEVKALTGSGTVMGNVASSGDIAPGNSPGTLTIAGNLAFGAMSTVTLEITDAGSDQLKVTGALSGTTTVGVTVSGIPVPRGTPIDLVVSASGANAALMGWTDGSVFTSGMSSFNVTHTDSLLRLVAVPEPTSMLLGLAGVGMIFRRRRQSA